MYAVFETGGKQYKVSVGDKILVEKLDGSEGSPIKFDKVLLLSDGKSLMVGNPWLENISVEGKIVSQTKGDKIRISKFKAKVRYRKTVGHRQKLSAVSITKVSTKSGAKPEKKKLTTVKK